MTAKILPTVVTAILLGTTALASAQSRTDQSRTDWNDPYLRGLAPDYGSQRDPYGGTVWDGIAPYSAGPQSYNSAPGRTPRNR